MSDKAVRTLQSAHQTQHVSTGMYSLRCCAVILSQVAVVCLGVAVLEAVEEDQLQQHAHEVGTYLIQQLEGLQKVHLHSMMY